MIQLRTPGKGVRLLGVGILTALTLSVGALAPAPPVAAAPLESVNARAWTQEGDTYEEDLGYEYSADEYGYSFDYSGDEDAYIDDGEDGSGAVPPASGEPGQAVPIPTHDFEAIAAAAKPSSIVASWRDAKGVPVKMYQGTYSSKTGNGFGWAKVKNRHGIKKYQTVKHPTGNPAGPKIKNTKREYVAYATKWQNRKIVAQIPVLTVVQTKYEKSYWEVKINSNPGVLTTYCQNPKKELKCPKWVDTAFSKANNGVAKAAPSGDKPDADGYQYAWSYEPVK